MVTCSHAVVWWCPCPTLLVLTAQHRWRLSAALLIVYAVYGIWCGTLPGSIVWCAHSSHGVMHSQATSCGVLTGRMVWCTHRRHRVVCSQVTDEPCFGIHEVDHWHSRLPPLRVTVRALRLVLAATMHRSHGLGMLLCSHGQAECSQPGPNAVQGRVLCRAGHAV